MPKPHEIQSLKVEFEDELFESVLPFWERHSPDREHGGYFNHLDYDGKVYDPTKNVWLQARQVWLFSKLFNEVEKNPNWLELAGTKNMADSFVSWMPGGLPPPNWSGI